MPRPDKPLSAEEDERKPGPKIRLDSFIPALITRAAHRLAANNTAAYKARFDVTLMEWRLLLHLNRQPGANAGRLASLMGYDKGTISRAVEQLQQRDLISISLNSKDARKADLRLTEAGQSLHDALLPVALEQERAMLSKLSPDEVNLLADMLRRINEALAEAGAGSRRRDRET